MKKILKIVAVLIGLLIAAVAILPFVIKPEDFRDEINQALAEATGRKVAINGAIKLAVFPNISVTLEDVVVPSPQGFAKDLATIKSLSLDVALLPLLGGKVEMNKFTLKEPVIRLIKKNDGRQNWVFTKGKETTQVKDDSGHATPQEISLGPIQIENATLSYADRVTGTSQAFEKVNITLDIKNMDSPATIEASGVLRAQQVKIKAEIGNFADFIHEKKTSAAITLDSSLVNASLKGHVEKQIFVGRADIASPSLHTLAQWWDPSYKPVTRTALAFNLSGNLSASGGKASLSGVTINLDNIKASGDMAADWSQPVLAIKSVLATDKLDINPYMPEEVAAAAQGGSAPKQQGWSNERIDFSALKAINAEMSFAAKNFLVRKIEVENTKLVASIKSGVLNLSLADMKLYGGTGSALVIVNANDGAAHIEKRVKLENIQVEPLFKAAADFEKLEGTGNLEFSVTTNGKSEAEMVNGLNGNGKLMFADGAIKGVNLASMVRNIESAFKNVDAAAQKTDFAELGGTFTITNGIVENRDLSMKAPALRLKGEGKADLPKRQINYRFVPEVVASLKGQGGKDKEGIAIPVIMEGPLDNPRFRPDLKALVQEGLKDPQKLKEKVKDAGEQIKGLLKGL